MNQIIDDILQKTDLKSKDIPTLDLYMDQIMTLFDDILKEDKRYKDDKILTKTMINNYSKAGLIKPIKGKKYTKEQILQMLIVYHLKNTISMNEIKQITTPIYEKDISLQEIYDRFISIKEEQNIHTKDTLQKMLSLHNLSIDTETDRLLIILYLSTLATQITNIVEKIIDTYYIDNKE